MQPRRVSQVQCAALCLLTCVQETTLLFRVDTTVMMCMHSRCSFVPLRHEYAVCKTNNPCSHATKAP